MFMVDAMFVRDTRNGAFPRLYMFNAQFDNFRKGVLLHFFKKTMDASEYFGLYTSCTQYEH